MLAYEVIETCETIALLDKDIRTDTYRGTGPGGQHKNKTESAVRMTHLPTGTVVTATESRSQIKNRKVALDRLHRALGPQNQSSCVLEGSVWLWCEWRDQVKLPDGTKRSMRAVQTKGL